MAVREKYAAFFLAGIYFGIPVVSVQEVLEYLEVIRVPLAPAALPGIINLRGQILPMLDLRERLQLSDTDKRSLEDTRMAVVRTQDGSEMSRNLTDAAEGATQVTENIGGVSQAAQNTSQGATDSLKAAQQLAQLSHKLRQLVEQFKLEKYSGNSPSRSYIRPSSHGESPSEQEQQEEVFTREQFVAIARPPPAPGRFFFVRTSANNNQSSFFLAK